MPDSNEPQNRPEGKTVYRPAEPDTPDIPLADEAEPETKLKPETEPEVPKPIEPPAGSSPELEFPPGTEDDNDEGPIELDPG